MFEVSVEDTFAAGHYLRNYKGKVRKTRTATNYRVRVTTGWPGVGSSRAAPRFQETCAR